LLILDSLAAALFASAAPREDESHLDCIEETVCRKATISEIT
jgi:hypothetical protein